MIVVLRTIIISVHHLNITSKCLVTRTRLFTLTPWWHCLSFPKSSVHFNHKHCNHFHVRSCLGGICFDIYIGSTSYCTSYFRWGVYAWRPYILSMICLMCSFKGWKITFIIAISMSVPHTWNMNKDIYFNFLLKLMHDNMQGIINIHDNHDLMVWGVFSRLRTCLHLSPAHYCELHHPLPKFMTYSHCFLSHFLKGFRN